MRSLLVMVVLAGAAHADPVNLLTRYRSTINVHSTVANNAIIPWHLVDGKPETAWNSATGDLVGTWIIVRLEGAVKVEAVKLTVGFTKVDKKLGDLFTKNPRIKKVRITHAKTVVEQDLDIASRDLQSIPITGGAGDYKIEVLAVEMGSKKDWRETCISELEVWGTGDPTSASPTRPSVYVNSFYPPPALSDGECQKLFDSTDATATVLSSDYAVCDVSDQKPEHYFDPVTHTITLVALPKKALLKESVTVSTQIYEGLGSATDTRLSTSYELVGDNVLFITALGSSSWTNLPDDDGASLPAAKTTFGVYRATKAGLLDVLQIEGTHSCEFGEGAKGDLVFTCGKVVKHFKWDGTSYVKR